MTAYHRRPALGAVRAGFSRSRRGDGLQHFLIAPRLPVPPPAAPPPRPRADRWRCPCLDSQRSYSSGPTHVLLGSAKLLLAAADAKARPRRDFGQVFQWVSVRLACKSTTLGACSGKVDTGFPTDMRRRKRSRAYSDPFDRNTLWRHRRSCSGPNGQPAEGPSSPAWRRIAAPCRPASSAPPSRGSRAAARRRRPGRWRMPWRRPRPHRS